MLKEFASLVWASREPSLPPPVRLGLQTLAYLIWAQVQGAQWADCPARADLHSSWAGTPDSPEEVGHLWPFAYLTMDFLGLPAGPILRPRVPPSALGVAIRGHAAHCAFHLPWDFVKPRPRPRVWLPLLPEDPHGLHDELRPSFWIPLICWLPPPLPPAPGPKSFYWPAWLGGNPSLGPLLYLWSLNLPGEPTHIPPGTQGP